VARRKKADRQAFVLVRLGWEQNYRDRSFSRVWAGEEGQSLGRPVAVFSDRQAAQAHKKELERQERSALDPFTFVGPGDYDLRDVSSLSAEQFAARLEELVPKAPLPQPGEYGEPKWTEWWAKVADTLSDEQRQAVWGLLDRLEFYHVLPTQIE
jgi:hypothetical protein